MGSNDFALDDPEIFIMILLFFPAAVFGVLASLAIWHYQWDKWGWGWFIPIFVCGIVFVSYCVWFIVSVIVSVIVNKLEDIKKEREKIS